MTPDEYRQARELFEQALDLHPQEAERWLNTRAAGSAIVGEVRALLAEHSRAGNFLHAAPAGAIEALADRFAEYAPGTVLGPYVIEREVARGGMGCVYLAVDQRLGRKVALKTLPSSLTASDAQRQRLRREARAAASLAHPGICTVHALEEIGDEVFIVTEFIEGRTLREELDAGRPDVQTLRATAQELADAIASAHEQGITHRDLKPENVMRAKSGRLKVLDFGLALVDPREDGAAFDHAAARVPRVTAPGAFIGTPGYMAPEQLAGDPVDARTDVFAIGVLLYEFATGRHPFHAPNPLVQAARILEAEPTPIESLRPDVPPDIARVVERSLQKSPSDRFANAGELAGALAAVPERPQMADAMRSSPASLDRGVSAWWRTHQLVVIGLYIVAVVLAWFVKEWVHGLADPMFFAAGIAATVAGVFRGHLLFTERMNPASFSAERRRASPLTLTLDLALGLILLSEGLLLASTRAVAAVLTMALAAGLVLARVVLERSTTQAAFGEQ
jgi:serine/threonine protein kinase